MHIKTLKLNFSLQYLVVFDVDKCKYASTENSNKKWGGILIAFQNSLCMQFLLT